MKAFLFDFFGVVADMRMAFVGEPGDGTHRLIIHEVVTDTAMALRDAGFLTALVTNNDRAAFESSDADLPLDQWFDVVVYSSDAGAQKPDRRIFDLALERLGVESSEAFFLDDVARNVDAAEALGITGHIVNDPNEVPLVLAKYL